MAADDVGIDIVKVLADVPGLEREEQVPANSEQERGGQQPTVLALPAGALAYKPDVRRHECGKRQAGRDKRYEALPVDLHRAAVTGNGRKVVSGKLRQQVERVTSGQEACQDPS